MRIRQAKAGDIVNIYGLVKEMAKKELVLPKSKGKIAAMLANYYVAEENGEFLGNCGFKIDPDLRAEVVSFVVRDGFNGRGIGSELLKTVLKRIRSLGVKNAYALTLRPDIFLRLGFRKVDKRTLSRKIWEDCAACPRNEADPGSVNCPEEAVVKEW